MVGMTDYDFRWRPRETVLYVQRVLVEEFDIPDRAPDDLKEALARRSLVSAGGTCPCGARAIPPDRAARCRAARTGTPYLITEAHHDPECPAAFRGFALVDIGPEVGR
jgi:hypothetical protein